jgi:hypothetical protein
MICYSIRKLTGISSTMGSKPNVVDAVRALTELREYYGSPEYFADTGEWFTVHKQKGRK